MKNILNLSILFALICCFSCQPNSEQWSSLEIRKLEQGDKPVLENAVIGDVVVFESGPPEFIAYNFAYHHAISGELKGYHATYGMEGGFDKGFYRWIDDTTIAVKMTYPNADSCVVFELFGNGNSSGIMLPD